MVSKELKGIFRKIKKSVKYSTIHEDTVIRVLKDVTIRYPKKRWLSETKKQLHLIWGAFFSNPNYEKILANIKSQTADGVKAKEICKEVLLLQSSTRERLPLLNHFYNDIFKITGLPQTIVEYGAGLNPITYPWINNEIYYTGFDIDVNLANFINSSAEQLKFNDYVKAKLGDILIDDLPKADMYFLFKLLPLLEQQEKGSSKQILSKILSKYIIVSYPTKSISGKNKGMEEFYTNQFKELIRSRNWKINKMSYEHEIVFVIKK